MKTLLILTAYIAPFLFIPAVFRFAGGILGNLSGMVNNRAKGMFDRQRKYRDKSRQETMGRAKTGGRFKWGDAKSKNFFARQAGRLNTATQKGYKLPAAIGESLAHPSTIRANVQSRLGASSTIDAANKFLNEAEAAQAAKANDNILGAVIESGASTDPKVVRDSVVKWGRKMVPNMVEIEEDVMEDVVNKAGRVVGQRPVMEKVMAVDSNGQAVEIEQVKKKRTLVQDGEKDSGESIYENEAQVDQAVSQAIRFVNESGGREVAMTAAALAMPATGTGFNTDLTMMGLIDKVAVDDVAMRGRMLAQMRTGALQGGRVDQGGGSFGDGMATLAKLRYANTHGGKLADGSDFNEIDATNEVADSSARSNGPAQLLYGKPQSTEAIAEAFGRRLEKAIKSVSTATNDTDRSKALNEVSLTMASIGGLHDAQAGSASLNSGKIADLLGRSYNMEAPGVPPELKKLFGTTLGAVPDIDEKTGEVKIDVRTGEAKMKSGFVQDTRKVLTVKDIMGNLAKTDKVYNQGHREWMDAATAHADAEASAAAGKAMGMKPPGE